MGRIKKGEEEKFKREEEEEIKTIRDVARN